MGKDVIDFTDLDDIRFPHIKMDEDTKAFLDDREPISERPLPSNEEPLEITDLLLPSTRRINRLEKRGGIKMAYDNDSEYLDPLKVLGARVGMMENDQKRRLEQARFDEQIDTQQALNADIAKVDEELESEGFPGFDLMTGEVTKELDRLIKEDPQNKRVLDNPKGWKRVYKKTIFPSVSTRFGTTKEVAEHNESQEKEDEWTETDYAKMRYRQEL